MTTPHNNFERAFLEEDSQIAFVHPHLRETFLEWVHERGCELFQVPLVMDEKGHLTLRKPEDDLTTYCLTPNDERVKESLFRG